MTKANSFKRLLCGSALALSLFVGGGTAYGQVTHQSLGQVVGNVTTVTAHADNLNNDTDAGSSQTVSDQSTKNLQDGVTNAVKNKKYPTQGGGYMNGSNVVHKGDIIDSNYDQLTDSGKQAVVGDMVANAKGQAKKTAAKQESGGSTSSGAVTDQTVTNWIQQIQDHPGVGAKMLTTTLQDVKPDYSSASYIIQPFKGPLNTAIAVIVILVMFGLTFTFAVDLAYLYIPLFNSSVDEGSGGSDQNGNKLMKPSSWVSRDARKAYEETDSDGKNPAISYFKKRFVGCIMLGLCILFFAQGKIFQIVGWILDLVSGVLHLS